MSLRLLLVDDNPGFLQAARGLLEQQGMTVAAVASTSAAALERVADADPDVILVDVDLGTESGFDLTARLMEAEAAEHAPPVILISTYAEEDLAELVRASAAVGFVSKADLSARAILDLLAEAGRSG